MSVVSEVDPLSEQPGSAVDADEWSFHHRLLYRLVLGTAGQTTAELQLLYDVVAPVAYRGVTVSPADSRRWRRKLLNDLSDAGVIEAHETLQGRVWTPTRGVDDHAERRFGPPQQSTGPP